MFGGHRAENGIDDKGQSRVLVRGSRIVEVRIRRLSHVDEVATLHAQVTRAIRGIGSGAIICADHRRAFPVSGEVADALSRAMRSNNDGIARSGTLLAPQNTMYNLQVERVMQCAGNPARRLFANLDELREWVGEPLAVAERDALHDLFVAIPEDEVHSASGR
jgi:hypothetical protein